MNKIYFNYKKFGVHPFSWKFVQVIAVLLVVLTVGYFLPNTPYKFINLCYKPAVSLVVFGLANQILNIIPIKEVLPKSLFK